MSFEETKPKHTLSNINKSLCWLLALILISMCISYYITTVMQVQLSKMSSETIKLNNENVELQNKLDNLMSYNNVEELVRQTGILDTAKYVVEIDYKQNDTAPKKLPKKHSHNYYHWSLGF